MIYITRPVQESHKIIPSKLDVKSDKSYLDNDVNRERENTYHSDTKKEKGDFTLSELENAVKETNNLLFRENSRFEFRIHERTKRVIVRLLDTDTDEVIREMPPEKMLDVVGGIWDFVGILVDERG